MRAVLRKAFVLCALAPGCSTSPGTGGTGTPDLAQPAPDLSTAARTYSVERVTAVGQGGFQTTIAVGPSSTVGFATLSWTASKSTCNTMNGPMDARDYDVWFAESRAGAPFAATKVSTEKYLSLTGVGLAYAPGGDTAIAWTGNAMGVKPATLRCGASNLLLATGKGGVFAAPKAVATSSQSAMLVPDQSKSCVQNVCNLGDATGYWPTVAYAPSSPGAPGVAFRDLHYGFAATDFASSDVEYAEGPAFSLLTVDVARGGGAYARLAYAPNSDPAILHYNGERETSTDGIWLNRKFESQWTATRISPAKIGEQLGFGINANGLYAVAYYDADAAKLEYLESANGTDWTGPVDVDTDGVTGQFPSLAFGSDGEPAIAYYRCRDYDPMNRSCDAEKDGLKLARRSGGAWQVDSVSDEPGLSDGLYPALAFVDGKAVVAYQTRAFDPDTMATTYEQRVAREQ